jgi:Family of unknown function (DUF5677)
MSVTTNENIFPDPPRIDQSELEECRRTGDFCPILFEWYKYTAIIANIIASIQLESAAANPVSKPHYGALIGLLNRCSRLMLANVALSHEGLYGETTAIIDRCIFESAVKVLWLTKQEAGTGFSRYIAEGLKTELALKSEIDARVEEREGRKLPIEERMLSSIERYLRVSGLTAPEIASAKKLPDLASMLDNLGNERLAYVVGQKIGSHHVHGTWPSLLMHYLEWDEEHNFRPRDHNASTHVNQYVFIPLMVLGAAKAFSQWLMQEPEARALVDLLNAIESELVKINSEVIGDDFSIVEKT